MSCLLYIGSVVRSILMSRIVCKLDKRKSSTVINLCWEHESDLFNSHLRCKVDNALDILNCISVSISVSQTTVWEWCSSWPYECHETLVCIPCIYHVVEWITRCVHLEVVELWMPILDQLVKLLLTCCGRICVSGYDSICSVIVLHSDYECKILWLARSKCEFCLESTAGIAVVVELVAKISIYNSDRIAVAVISSKELLLVTTVWCNITSGKCKESFVCLTSIDLSLLNILIDDLKDLVVVHEICSGYEQCILEIYLILLIIAVICKLTVSDSWKVTRLIRVVGNSHLPHFMCLVKWNIIHHLWLDIRILCIHLCICRSMVTFTLIHIKTLAYRLPWCWPVILCVIIAKIYISSRLIKAVKYVSQYSSVCSWLLKAVASCVVGDYSSVFRWTKVVCPRCRGVWSVNYILFVLFVKITVSHMFPLKSAFIF